MSPNLRGILYALVAFGLFSAHDVLIKMLGGDYSPVQIIFFASLVGFPLTAVMLLSDTEPATLQPRRPLWMAVRTAAGMLAGLMGFFAIGALPLAHVYAMLFASPLFITILSVPFLNERVGWHRGLAVAVGLIGVLIVLRPGGQPLTLGHMAGLAAALFGSLNVIVTRKIAAQERSVVMMLIPMLANVAVMGLALPFVYNPMPGADLGMIIGVATLAFLAGLMVVKAYSVGETGVVAPMQYSQILWATLFGWLFFAETMDVPTLIGVTVIVASGVYIVLREGQGVSENRPVSRSRFRFDTGTGLRVGAFFRRRSERAKRSR